ncbi:MAG TPA: hypothetical protein VL947_02590 [Cytophagales bacterium]|nr:hypothetical protein [Cytophagales bacterium]
MKNILFILLLLSVGLFAQSKPTIKKNKIKSTTTEATKVEEGKTVIKKEVEVYDDNGNVIEKAVYVNDKLQEKNTYAFNKNGDETQHVYYNSDGSVKKKVQFKYNSNNDETEEATYDAAGNLIKKKVSDYNNFGEKTTETVYDGKGTLIEKSVYTYDNKGLKKERLTYDIDNRLIGKKTYTYTFK